jgi:predicted HAD superfamily Cof-like phosphohydrolase
MSFALVQEFNDLFEVKTRAAGIARVREAKLRFGLIKEELQELLDAIEDVDIVEVADALGDIEYVTVGALQVFGYGSIAIEKFKLLMETQFESDLDQMDLSTNPLLTPEGQQEILDDLRLYMLTAEDDHLSSSLVTLLYLVALAGAYYKIEIADVVEAIHKSNMTKLGANGEVLRNEKNKVIKGPNYQSPTKDIENILFGEEDADSSE